jgi:predicted anti-sigma-YlaC factor YlaD
MSDPKTSFTCLEVRQRLDDYLDQEMSSLEAYQMLKHLSGCSACSAASERNYTLLAQLRDAVQQISLPPGMEHRLSKKLESCRKHTR